MRKRGSVMRRPTKRVEERTCRMILGVSNDSHANAKTSGNSALWHGFGSVVGALGVNVRSKFFEESFHVGFRKKHNVIDVAQRGDKGWPRDFTEDGTPRTFPRPTAACAIHGTNGEAAPT